MSLDRSHVDGHLMLLHESTAERAIWLDVVIWSQDPAELEEVSLTGILSGNGMDAAGLLAAGTLAKLPLGEYFRHCQALPLCSLCQYQQTAMREDQFREITGIHLRGIRHSLLSTAAGRVGVALAGELDVSNEPVLTYVVQGRLPAAGQRGTRSFRARGGRRADRGVRLRGAGYRAHRIGQAAGRRRGGLAVAGMQLLLAGRQPDRGGDGIRHRGGCAVASTTADRAARPLVAVVGTGTMGSAMARNLLRAGLVVYVWDRTPAAVARLAAAGAAAHDRPGQAVAHADVVITMLADEAAVLSVAIDQDMLDMLQQGAVWAQMATIGVQATERLAQIVADARPDVRFVDAPVSGTRQPAEAGQLLILASGPEAAAAPLEPVFQAIGSRTLWLGKAGAGSRLKLVLNTWLAFLIEGIAESVALADRLGVGHQALREALRGSPLEAPVALAKLAKMDAGDESPDFALHWAVKDVDLALAEGGQQALPVADTIGRRWHQLIEAGFGQADVVAARHGLGQDALTS